MKLKSFGLIVASCGLASVVYGCATADQRSVTETRSASGNNNEFCAWTFDRVIGGGKKIQKESLKVKDKDGVQPGTCSIYHSGNNELYIGDTRQNVKKVLDIDAEFKTEGTCRYCYVNQYGGMSCVTYPGC